MRGTWWLETEDRVRRRVGSGGVTLGRSPRCDVVLASQRASRVQALAHVGSDGPQLVRLGRGTMRVNGEEVEHERDLKEGDLVELPGLALRVVVGAETMSGGESPVWVIERADQALFGIARTPFRIGGGSHDDLQLDGWPPQAIVIHVTPTRLRAEALATLVVDGETLTTGASRSIGRGSTLCWGDETLTVVTGGALGSESTVRGGESRPRIALEFLPRGGRLVIGGPAGEVAMYLPDRRCDLVAVLLTPPEPQHGGDFIDDEVVLARVWGKELRSRTDLNVLVHRLRRDLTAAGLEGVTVIERAKGGGATRFVLDPDTIVEVA